MHSQQESFGDNLREIKDENGRLRKILLEKDYEISFLKKKLEEEKQIIGSITNDVAATKIIDLAKKVRELTAQVESEKAKNKQLTKNLNDIESKVYKNNTGEEKEHLFVDENIEKIKNLRLENKDLNEKYNQINHKTIEYKSQCEILKQELRKTQKALEKEVGDNVDIKSILSGQSNWKGRQQQIINLQRKLTEMKQRTESALDLRTCSFGDELNEMNVSEINSAHSIKTNFDSKNRNDLRRLGKEKKDQFERMKKENDLIENELNIIKEKNEAIKARNKVLLSENKSFKEQIKTLIDKGKHDDELIEALMKKQNSLKELLENFSYINERNSNEKEEKLKENHVKYMQEKNTCEQLKLIIQEREKRVKQLEDEIKFFKENQTNNKNFLKEDMVVFKKKNNLLLNKNILNPEILSDQISSQIENVNINDLNAVETRSSTSSLREIKNGYLIQTSKNILNAEAINQRKEQSINIKLENTELKTLYSSSEIERLRLLDLVKTLQKRIEELNQRSIDIENKSNEQRRKSINLEKQLEQMKLDLKSSNQNKVKLDPNILTIEQYKLEELETSLLIQKDENDALKAALKSTLEAKEEDLRLYCEMLESTKKVFLDGLKQYKAILDKI